MMSETWITTYGWRPECPYCMAFLSKPSIAEAIVGHIDCDNCRATNVPIPFDARKDFLEQAFPHKDTPHDTE